MWWGYSQALDLLDENSEYDESEVLNSGDAERITRNILLLGQTDCRHVLKTIARKYRHKKYDKINLYVYEPLLENVARELLFLTLALEPPEHLGIAEKTLFFMELYGNTLLRPTTANYLTKLSKRLLNVITNFNYAQQILPSVCLEKLKYKERDQLEVIFKYWALNDKTFDILTAWDERVRKHLGIRYDSRIGVYDWDYHMRYRCYGGDVLHLQEYKRFREKGISFYFDDTDPCVSNATLASAIFSSGSKILTYGYLGDIITGPYVAFGLNCEDSDMLKKVNGQMRKTATNITERNIMRIFHEIQYQTPFIPLPENEDECVGAILKDESSRLKIQPDLVGKETCKIEIKDSSPVYQSLNTHNCQIIFMPTSALSNLSKKSEYENFFDAAFIAQTIIMKQINPDLFKVIKPKGVVTVDTPKFLLNYRKEDLEQYQKDLKDLINKSCYKIVQNSYNFEKDEFVRFTVEK